MNENPSVRIESPGSKTCDNCPLKNGSAVSIARLYVGSKIVCFYESNHAFQTIWRHPLFVSPHKNKGIFLETRYAIIVINTSCCIMNQNGALALFEIFAGRKSCNKRPHNQYLFL